ncbi:MAG TPA: GGDEF domain-containing protein [Kineosporiaceae bacterium]
MPSPPGDDVRLSSSDDLDVGERSARLVAHVAAYELVVTSQNECAEDRIAPLLELAGAKDWPEVAFVLHYARLVRVRVAGGVVDEHLAAMFTTADAADDLALLALALAAQASSTPSDTGDGEDDGALVRAVTMLEEAPGAPVDRLVAYVQCGQAYQSRGLWELEEEMYARASAELAHPSPPKLGGVLELCRRVVLMNRLEAQLAGACALLELGERGDARAYARRRQEWSDAEHRALPHQFARDMAAVRRLLAAIAQEPEGEPFEAAMAAVGEPVWPGYRACVLLSASVRRLDAEDPSSAAEYARLALADLDQEYRYLPTVRTLALSLAAAGEAAPSARRYAAELAQLRWQARQRVLASSRARLEAERVLLENERLAQRAYVDELTGLGNRHAYVRQVGRMRRGRVDHGIAVLMVDIDRFKQVNDRYGHAIGDEVLRRIGSLLLERSRAGDLVARLGGDEFIVVLDLVRPLEAAGRAEEFVRAVAGHEWRDLADGLAVTVSAGLACGSVQTIDDLVPCADQNLYRAKAAGRGRLARDAAASPALLDTLALESGFPGPPVQRDLGVC